MQVSILGPVEACVGAGPAPLRRGRQPLLLAQLALHPRRVVPVHQLVDALWPAGLPVDPENALHQVVSQLRRALRPEGAALQTVPGGYRLDVADGEVDARCFEGELALAGQALAERRYDEAAWAAARALGRWRGPAIGGIADGPLASHAVALEAARTNAQVVLADARLALGRAGAVVDQLGPLVAEQPYDEGLWARLLGALAAQGRPAEALRRLDELAGRLAVDLGARPGPELQELRRRLTAGEAGALGARRHDGGDAHPVAAAPHRRPAHPGAAGRRRRPAIASARARTSFIGRGDEQAGLVARLRGVPGVVSVVGPAGCGKTRLALEAAVEVEATGRGVTLVRLDAVGGDDGVGSAVAAAAGLTEDGGRQLLDVLAEELGGQLLVLDNVEHVRAGAARLCEALLGLQPDLVVLATGRQRLGVDGEQVVRLAPLALPGPPGAATGPAVELLLDRAAAVTASTTWGPAELDAAARLVVSLDGLPLAIELVAAQAAALSLPQLAATLGERLGLLEAPGAAGPPRHARLHDAIEWGLELLAPPERDLFLACGVFAGPFDVAAAAQAAGLGANEALPRLVALVERCLLEPSPSTPERPAFRMLETLRAHARRRLEAAGELAGRRAQLLDDLVVEAEAGDAGLRGPAQADWLARFDLAAADVAASLAFALDHGRVDQASRLVAATCRYWDWRGRLHEADRATAAVLGAPAAQLAPGHASVLAWRAWIDAELGNGAAATAAAREALEAARGRGDVDTELLSLATAASVARRDGRLEAVVALVEEAEHLALGHGLAWSAGRAAVNRGHARLALGHVDDARHDAKVARARFEQVGDVRGVAWADALDALCATHDGAAGRAGDTAARALEVAEKLGDQRTCLLLLEILALDARHRGEPALAASLAEEASRRRQDRGQARHPLHDAGPA